MDKDDASRHLREIIRDSEELVPRTTFEDAFYRRPVANTAGPSADQLLDERRREQERTPKRVTDQEQAAQELADLVNREMGHG